MDKELWEEDAAADGYMSDYQKEYQSAHRLQLNDYMKTYRKDHAEKIRRQDREAAARYRSRKGKGAHDLPDP